MKRWLSLLLLLSLLPLSSLADGKLTVLYDARVDRAVRLRIEPDEASKGLSKIPEGEKVWVYDWQTDWSKVFYGGEIGYVPTDVLFEFWRRADQQVPDYHATTGIAVITAAATVDTEDTVSRLNPGDQLAVSDETGRLPFMRGEAALASGSFDYTPFATVDNAEPGDVLYAFTTFFADDTGGRLAENRQKNMALACTLLNGAALPVGGSLSFNRLCGPYQKGKGYVKAPNISTDGVGIGGGVCQVTTTLFDAVLGLNLTLEDWHVHRASGVPYVPRSLDAAVGTYRDFEFRNSLEVPLTVQCVMMDNAITVLLLCGEQA